MFFCISFSLAIIASGFQTWLLFPLTAQIIFYLGVSLLIPCWRYPQWRSLLLVLAGICTGIAYVNLVGRASLDNHLPINLENNDIEVKVQIAGLPVQKVRYQQYMAAVISSVTPDNNVQLKRILLNDYQPKNIHPCEIWQLTVRLKRPHGLGNPAGFDYEAYLLEQGVQAKGYVRKAELLKASEGFCLHGVRQSWSDYVVQRLPIESAAWIVALSTGDKSLLNEEQNLLLRETGTTHLFVISGSHIALCALVVYGFLMLLRRCGGGRIWPGDWRPGVALAALIVAAIYTALAGFGVPSVRSLIMLMVFLGAQVVGLQTSLWLRYWISMAAVLLLNPLSALNVGFVLSFGAVFILILLAESRSRVPDDAGRLERSVYACKTLFWAQGVIFIGLLPFTLLYFAQVSLLAPFVNFIAVPSMSFVILPTILLALFLWLVSGKDGGLLDFAAYQLDLLFRGIDISNAFFKQMLVTFPTFAFSHTMIAVLLIASLMMLLPRVLMMRQTGLLLLLAVFASDALKPLPENSLVMDVIDVDQGLAILVQTAHHQLLFDTGSAWGQGSMMERAVKPYLLQKGITYLDKVMISHLDNDHAGGIDDLLKDFAVAEIWSSEPLPHIESNTCLAGQQWHWDGVDFRVLHPDDPEHYWKTNDKSCVLLITVAGRNILLPGDIGAQVEQKLLSQPFPAIDVMVAPHHGSKSSSTSGWVEKVRNGLVIYSSGYLSQFGHPHPLVQQRYEEANVQQWNTALQGLVSVNIDAMGVVKVSGWREAEGKYWQKMQRKVNSRG
jgi:competence protein ComEC